MSTRRLSGGQIVTIVVSVCAAAVLAPVGVWAATGSFVNITDPVVSSYKARVNAGGGVLVTNVDPVTKSQAKVDTGRLRVGDGSGALTVDGTVDTTDRGALVYKSPTGGLTCGTDAAGVPLGVKDLSRFSKVRIFVKSGTNYQTIVQMRPVAGSETYAVPWLDFTAPHSQYSSGTFNDPPPLSELRILFCKDAQIFIYGLK